MLILRLFSLFLICAAQTTSKPSAWSRAKEKLVKHGNRFREWLKWDADCNFLTPEERLAKVVEGRCPTLKTTTTPLPTPSTKPSWWKRMLQKKKKKPKKIGFLEKKKQKLLTVFQSGKMNKVLIDLTVSHTSHTVMSGSMLILSCDYPSNKTGDVTWYVNTNRIEPGLLNWRVSVQEKNMIIWPLTEEDEGHFECTVDGVHHASAIIDVVSRKEALIGGFCNYLIVLAIFIPLGLFALYLIGDSAINPPQVKERSDRMAEFLQQQILESRTAENLARIVHGEDFEKRKAVVEASMRTTVGGGRGNKDTVMTVLMPLEEPPTSIRTRGQRGTTSSAMMK